MDQGEQGGLVLVRRCANRREAEQYALVLAARRIQSFIAPEGGFMALYVALEDAAKAHDELTAYDSENVKPPPESGPRRPPLPRVEVAMVYWAVLLFFFAAARHNAFSIDWLEAGAAQTGSMLHGEWWRAVTALCLHAGGAHILGNLVFGTAFLLLLAQVTGAGMACLSMVVTGAAGNILNALVQPSAHTSIGASTAIFGGLGILAVLRQVHGSHRVLAALRRWTPLAGGVGLLVFLGFSGKNTDVFAHVLGFGSGLAAGWMLARWKRDWPTDRSLQWKCAGAAGAILTAAWAAAIFA